MEISSSHKTCHEPSGAGRMNHTMKENCKVIYVMKCSRLISILLLSSQQASKQKFQFTNVKLSFYVAECGKFKKLAEANQGKLLQQTLF